VSRLRRKPSKLATASAPRQEVLAPAVFNPKKSVRLTLWPLVAATFFMVSGGTYGTEDIVHGAGYGRAILILLLTPILWSLPTAFMIGELSSALPFALMVFLSPFKFGALAHAVTKPTTSTVDILGGLLICMWNYMGWDNASTIATEVERPQRTYPRAMLAAVGIVGLTYILPVAAVWLTGLAPTAWETGSWADIAGMLGGPLLRIALVLGGMMSGFGMFNA